MGLKHNIMVQEYIAKAGGADIRCFVVGDKVIASMKRQAAPGEFRSNLHRGGSASLIKITPEERMTAIRAARVMGLNVAGGHPALQPWSAGNGGELLAGPGRYRIHHRQGHRRDHHPVPGKNGGPHLARTKGKG